MRIYLQNFPAKFHPDPILIDEALRLFDDGRPNKINEKKNNKMSRIWD